MKKILCIGLVLLLFISVPIKGYSASPVVYGIGEEVILPFLLALLGVQSKETVTSYNDLKDYHDEVYSTLIENLSGLAGIDTINSWLYSAAQGLINTNSVVWQKLQELAISNYVVASSETVEVPVNSSLGTNAFTIYYFDSMAGQFTLSVSTGRALVFRTSERSGLMVVGASTSSNDYMTQWGNNLYFTSSYTYDGKTVYYNSIANFQPPNNGRLNYPVRSDMGSNVALYAWEMVYGSYVIPSDGVASYSDAFGSVLSSNEKDDIVDGTSVVQLYNPSVLQNGLEIIPGGDPEQDPNLKRIPFAVTADWWNFFQQFGEQSGNTYVNAYNALNGIGENVTTGLISKAYDALGIASIAGSAANAAQGIISLTDNNIYPASQTAADAITNTIPSGLIPEAPDSGIDNESDQGLYKLPDLRDYFPFCIPFDLIDFLSCFAAEPETPHFIVALSDGEHLAQENIDLEVFNDIAAMVRTFELAIFVVGLILITRNLIRG